MKLQASHHGRDGRHQAPPAVQTWSYRLDKAASYDLNLGNAELVVAGFFGAGLFNAIGTPGTQSDFARWGYPPWSRRLTGGLEMMSAVLIALPASRILGLALGATIIAVAVLTVLRHRDFSHLAPLSVFVALIALAVTSS